MATRRRRKSATFCIVRPACLFASGADAESFSHFAGERALHYFALHTLIKYGNRSYFKEGLNLEMEAWKTEG